MNRIRSTFTTALVVALFGIVFGPAAVGEEAEIDARADSIRSSYAKFEYRIPMRDGVSLFTAVYVPNDRSRTYPILMMRTPYGSGPYGADRYRERLGPSEQFEREGFIFVFQDVRGTFQSDGTFVNMRPHVADKRGPQDIDESSDAYDTIEWLLEHAPAHNGKVGVWGNSYPGFYAAAATIDGHPALVAASPQAPIADWWWDDMHRHGAFNLNLSFNFFATFGLPRPERITEWPDRFDHGTPDGYQFFLELGSLANVDERHFKGDVAFWDEIASHPNYDEFWQSRSILPHLDGISAAMLVVGGWYDTEDLYGPLRIYAEADAGNRAADIRLVMGPWSHGAWIRGAGRALGDEDFGFDTAKGYREDVLFPFFDHHLRGGAGPDLPEALMFETGADRWRRFDAWPPPEAESRTLYLREDGGLAFDPPEAVAPAFDDYVSDPAKPVPYTEEIRVRWSRDYMAADQRFAARRPDVLVYRSEPLEDDLTVAGPIQVRLRVSTTGTDADWVVKLIDVWPDRLPGHDEESNKRDRGGQQTLVRGEPFRGRFRESYETPVPFVPDEVAAVDFRVNDVFHTFKRGHRIMVQVQSSWFPFIDRNPQTFVPNIFTASESDFVRATHRVHRSVDQPSRIEILVLE